MRYIIVLMLLVGFAFSDWNVFLHYPVGTVKTFKNVSNVSVGEGYMTFTAKNGKKVIIQGTCIAVRN